MPLWLIAILYGIVGVVLLAPLLVREGVALRFVPAIVFLEPLRSGLGAFALILIVVGFFHRACASVLLGCFGVVLWTLAAFLRAT